MTPKTSPEPKLLALTAQIVAAHSAHSHLSTEALLGEIEAVYEALARNNAGTEAPAVQETVLTGKPASARPAPAVSPKHSVFPDYIVCLEDGRKMKMLTRYIGRVYGLTPDQYRARWGLPPHYPMSAPALSARRAAVIKRAAPWKAGGRRKGSKMAEAAD